MNIPMKFAKCLLLAPLLVAAAQTSAGDPRDIIDDIMRVRSEATCRALGPTFITSATGFHDPEVRGLAASCYTAKARLQLFGEPQQLIMGGTNVAELPIRMIAENTGLRLDPYHPLAGQTLRK